MSADDLRLIVSAILGIALAVALIVQAAGCIHSSACCAAPLSSGCCAGLPAARHRQGGGKGRGDILGGTGLVVALGLSLGAMLQLSNGASSLARAGAAADRGPRRALG